VEFEYTDKHRHRSKVYIGAGLIIAALVGLVVFVALRLANDSRTGRAWRSLREDPLAAEAMGMPTDWLKLMAFAFGSAVAALGGSLTTALNASVFPQNFEFPLLITVYTIVILGGAGSQVGVVLGAILISVLLEALREADDARYIFYSMAILGLVAALRLSHKLGLVLGGTIAFGFAGHALAEAIDPSWTAGAPYGPGRLADWVANWVIIPADLAGWIAPVSYIGLVAAALALTLIKGRLRLVLLVPTIYLAAFVWENVMLAKPESTRFIILGVILVAVMIARPSGILGERRVEIL